MGTIWTQPSPSDYQRWEALVLDGAEPSTAAKQVGFTCTRFRQADPARHAEILQAGQEARAGFVDEHVEIRALEPDAAPAVLLAWARRWNRAYTERQEVTGADGRPVEFALKEARGELAAGLSRIANRRAAGDTPSGAD